MTAGTGTKPPSTDPSTDPSTTPPGTKAVPPPTPPPTNTAPTGPSAGNNDGDGTGGGSSSSSDSGVTPNVPLFPQIDIPVNNNHTIGFQPITNQSWTHTSNTTVGCTPGNNGRGGNNRTVTTTNNTSVKKNYGCTLTHVYSKDDAQRDVSYEIATRIDIIKKNPGFSLELKYSF